MECCELSWDDIFRAIVMYARSGDLVTLDFAQKRMRAQVVENRMRP